MIIDYQIRDEKLQYDINREAPKYLPRHQAKFGSMNIHTCEEILQSNQQEIIEHAKFTYSPLGKAYEKQTKAIED